VALQYILINSQKDGNTSQLTKNTEMFAFSQNIDLIMKIKFSFRKFSVNNSRDGVTTWASEHYAQNNNVVPLMSKYYWYISPDFCRYGGSASLCNDLSFQLWRFILAQSHVNCISVGVLTAGPCGRFRSYKHFNNLFWTFRHQTLTLNTILSSSQTF